MLLNMQEIVQLSVEKAVSKVLEESGQHASRFDCRGELKRMAESITLGFERVNDRLDDVNRSLATGATKFAVMDVEHSHLRTAVEDLEKSLDKREASNYRLRGTGPLAPAPLSDDEKPLVSPKVWNALLIAAVGALGTAGGAFVWDRIRGADQHPATISAPNTPSSKQQQQQQGP